MINAPPPLDTWTTLKQDKNLESVSMTDSFLFFVQTRRQKIDEVYHGAWEIPRDNQRFFFDYCKFMGVQTSR